MTNHRKKQTRDVGRTDDKDERPRPRNAPHTSGSPAPDTTAHILQSEDDELFDEDAPNQKRRCGSRGKTSGSYATAL
ncbi:hypothetical protein OKW42_006034 [Paraburkholderia sp. WC7.3d]